MTYNLDYTNTADLLAVYKIGKAPSTFLQDRYFKDGRNFATEEVLVEYKKGIQRLAPFVSPEINGKIVKREGYSAKAYKPALIAPKRSMTIDTLKRKGFGEAYYNQLTPQERAVKLAGEDLQEMREMIINRKEAMCAEVLQTNALIMNHYNDNNKLTETKEIAYYNGTSNPATYTPTTPWGQADANIFDDIDAIGTIMTDEGIPAIDVIMGTNAANAFWNDAKIREALDNRRIEIGELKPGRIGNDAYLMATLNIYGCDFNFIHYKGSYVDETGKRQKYIDPDNIVVTAPDCGEINYGAISQIDFGNSDFTTYVEKEVPLYEVKDQTRSLILRSAPLVQPKAQNAFYVSKVIF